MIKKNNIPTRFAAFGCICNFPATHLSTFATQKSLNIASLIYNVGRYF